MFHFKKIVLILTLLFSSAAYAEYPEPVRGLSLNDLRLIPTQTGGRIKPFDEFARETILSITGVRTFGKMDPSEMLISMMVEPKMWSELPIILISNDDLKKQMLLDQSRKYFSPDELMKNSVFNQYAQEVPPGSSSTTDKGIEFITNKKEPRTEELKRVVDRITRFQSLLSAQLWMVLPDQYQRWIPLAGLMQQQTAPVLAVMKLFRAYQQKNLESFSENTQLAKQSISELIPGLDEMKLKAEVLYNLLRPFLQSMIFYLIAGILWIFAQRYTFARLMAKFLTFAAILMHVFGFLLRCYVAGRPPVTNMYESIIWVSLGVMTFALLIYIKHRQNILLTTSTILAGLALFAADAAPMVMDPTIRPLVAVLRSNYWLTIHVLTITLGYAAFMLSMGLSNISLFQFTREISEEVEQNISLLNMLNYRALMFGTVFLAAGTILGGIWADSSWGRFWGWDAKEVWALIALLSYTAVLHARYTGWIGKFSFPLWTVVCFNTVLMAWYGVNFILGKGLHSYGFSSGGQSVMFGFLVLQSAYIAWVAFRK